jgi:hypothetical protein
MIHVKIVNGLPVDVVSDPPSRHGENSSSSGQWQSRHDWKSLDEVQRLARYLVAMTGKPYLAVDDGGGVSPRYDLVLAPMIGDEVSYGFNGDYYPDGVVTKISKTYQVTTSTGNVYRRQGNSACWKKTGGTWSLCRGHISEQNPHF